MEKFKKYFEVEYFDGSSESPLDEDQIHDNPMWVQDYLATAQPSLEKKHCFVCLNGRRSFDCRLFYVNPDE